VLSEEQASGASQINVAMSQLSQTTQQNATASEELAAMAEEMSSQAQQLQQSMVFFTIHTHAEGVPPMPSSVRHVRSHDTHTVVAKPLAVAAMSPGLRTATAPAQVARPAATTSALVEAETEEDEFVRFVGDPS
jgi:methyl-accepting chemotaxis protein